MQLLKASIASFGLVRERSPPRCLKAVCFPFLWPLLVFWVACHFDEVVFRGFLSIPRILTVSSFDSVRERALTRGSSRVVRIAASAQFVSLFLVFLRPLLVF